MNAEKKTDLTPRLLDRKNSSLVKVACSYRESDEILTHAKSEKLGDPLIINLHEQTDERCINIRLHDVRVLWNEQFRICHREDEVIQDRHDLWLSGRLQKLAVERMLPIVGDRDRAAFLFN